MSSLSLNNLQPQPGSRKKAVRVGRGGGSGLGKTCGRGHKGQKARSGGLRKRANFEGGQTPLQRRIPKMGFFSRMANSAQEIKLYELDRVAGDVVDPDSLRAARLLSRETTRIKIICTGKVSRALTIKGIRVTAGARKLIEAAGGKVEE